MTYAHSTGEYVKPVAEHIMKNKGSTALHGVSIAGLLGMLSFGLPMLMDLGEYKAKVDSYEITIKEQNEEHEEDEEKYNEKIEDLKGDLIRAQMNIENLKDKVKTIEFKLTFGTNFNPNSEGP